MRTRTRAPRASALVGCLLLFCCAAAPRASAQDEEELNSEARAPASAEETARSTVSGRAVFDDTGRPVRRARVMLLSIEGTHGQPSALMANVFLLATGYWLLATLH